MKGAGTMSLLRGLRMKSPKEKAGKTRFAIF